MGDEGVTGLVVAFVDYLTRIFVPIRTFSGKFAIIQRALTALERIFELIDTMKSFAAARQPLHQGPCHPLSKRARYVKKVQTSPQY